MRRYGYNTIEQLVRRDRPGEEEDAASVYRNSKEGWYTTARGEQWRKQSKGAMA